MSFTKSNKRFGQTFDSSDASKAKVLLIEDDRSTSRIVQAKLRDHCDLLVAENASSGATMYRKGHHDLVFLDIGLPDGNGYNLLQWMMLINPDAFAVMFTGSDSEEIIAKSIRAGAKGFLPKPFDEEKMLFFIQKSMGHQ